MKVKNIILALTALMFTSINVNSQILQPVKWTFYTKVINETEVKLVAKATIDKTWHLYGQYSEPAGGIPAEFIFNESSSYKKTGKVLEWPKPHKEYDDLMEANIQTFEKEAYFTQKVKVLSDNDFTVTVSFFGQACTDEGMCIPLNEDFEFKVPGLNSIKKQLQKETKDDTITEEVPDTNKVVTEEVDTNKTASDTSAVVAESNDTGEINSATDKGGFWALFIAALIAGFAAILTPCVFPMIPMTVSFFMHEKKSKAKSRAEAMFFSLSIIFIYTIIGTLVAVTLGPEFANWLSTHWIPNVLFFLVFMIFAASFFGMFEIVLPSWMTKSSEKQVDKGGFFAPFFMAFSLVVISFSCTGPLVGTVLVESAGGDVLRPIIGMLGFGLAFAIPFGIFAFFPHLMNKMPQSGGWLNSVKVVLGFIELALGLKFLSIADLTYHWGLLNREIYLALWITIFTLMGFYLLGKIKFSHDSDLPFLKVPRLVFAILTFSFVVYMIPGLFGAPLKILSGYLPPMSTHEFDIAKVVRMNSEGSGGSATETFSESNCFEPKYGDVHEMPHGLLGYFDYEQALACAKEQNKPVMLDFTGYACVNCRKMEDNVWGTEAVLPILKNDYVIASLYVDDRTELDKKDWVTSSYDGKVKKTLGSKYADFQISRFGMNAQPAYIILDYNGKVLIKDPYFYNPDPVAFSRFLREGIKKFKEKHK
ncbi:MAG: thioredoxin family protein [Bacteroidales bacterium]|nr:thioredoxin family protein [Bacteroidales bacterium]